MSYVPKNHPRYQSLIARHLLEDGVKSGVTTMTGLVAHGRGEAFDYLLGEKSHSFSKSACRAAAAAILLAQKPVISVNGNVAMLVPKDVARLAKTAKCLVEVNIFHESASRRRKIAAELQRCGVAKVLGIKTNAKLAGLNSARGNVDKDGIFTADVVLVSLEDGDRTEVLKSHGKQVIAIDLNPLSRTPKMSDIPIIDNVMRAMPLIEQNCRELRQLSQLRLKSIVRQFDKAKILRAAENALRKAV